MLVRYMLIFTFFPSLLFFVFPNNQIQPVYFIFAALIFMKPQNLKIYSEGVPLILLLLVMSLYLPITFITYSEFILSTIINFISYLAPMFFFFCFRSSGIQLKVRWFTWVLFIWALVSFHQNFVPKNPIGDLLEEVLRIFIADRFSMYSIAAGDRGGSGLTAEPAGAALIIVQFISLFRYFFLNGSFRHYEKHIWALLIFLLIISNTSGTLGLLLLVYVIVYFSNTGLYQRFRMIIAFASGSLALYFLGMSGRIGSIITELIEKSDMLTSVNIFYALTVFMGMRVYNWIYSYGSLVANLGLGHLVAGWQHKENMVSVINTIGWKPEYFQNFTNITYANHDFIKPWSFVSIISFDFGMLGFLLMVTFFALCWKKVSQTLRPEFFVGVTILLFFPPVSMATGWFLLALSLKGIKLWR